MAAALAATGERSVPLFVFDAGYEPIGLSYGLPHDDLAVLVHTRDDRVFCTDPPQPAPGRVGRPRRHIHRLICSQPDIWHQPDQRLVLEEPVYGTVHMACWSGMHPKLARRGRWAEHDPAPIIRGTIIRIQVQHLPKPTARATKTLWLWWAGPGRPDLKPGVA